LESAGLEETSSAGDRTAVVKSVVKHYIRGSQTVRRAPTQDSAVSPLVGGDVSMTVTFILNEIWERYKIYIFVGTLLGYNILLLCILL
jgi:hypothetical protein